jgi:3-oxoadipate enol-lactonase
VTLALNHELSGPDTAPPLALSNSVGTSLAMWDAQVPALATSFRVLRYDMRGHGASSVPDGPYSIADLGRDLISLLDSSGIERTSLCGLSIGAMVSIWVAAHAPDRVDRLILCCTSSWLGPVRSAAYRERAAAVREHGMEPIADAVLERWFTPAFRAARPEVAELVRARFVATAPEGYAGCCEALSELDLRDELPRVQAPTLVVAGAEDPATPPDDGRVIAERIDGARFELVPSAAHLANIEQPELVTRLIEGFLK